MLKINKISLLLVNMLAGKRRIGPLINFSKRVTGRRTFRATEKNPVNLEHPVNPVLLEHCDKRSGETVIAGGYHGVGLHAR
ncbi:hypothetical protein [Candidatus Thiosymbion oneisti]|uniref:hypothetical protein n=1 Tax=Candidatus Thiosymbion oneisti TaxID=589554 RepID=UPI00114D0EDF|nr:hypothetical protein [Candidatus Thiosymbion oneisti]